MRIGFDLDETLAPFMPPLIGYLHGKGIMVPPYEETSSFNLWEAWGCTLEESYQRVFDFYHSPAFLELRPYPEVPSLLAHLLQQGHEPYVITARPDSMMERTHAFFRRHLPNLFSGVHLTGQYASTSSASIARTKGVLSCELGLDLFVDDSLHHVAEVVSKGVSRVFLMTRPWNEGHVVPEGVSRIFSLEEAFSDVESYKKRDGN
ncbi:MAG: hypothetical protein AABX53_01050 [Nanoarchaeota archaeon]